MTLAVDPELDCEATPGDVFHRTGAPVTKSIVKPEGREVVSSIVTLLMSYDLLQLCIKKHHANTALFHDEHTITCYQPVKPPPSIDQGTTVTGPVKLSSFLLWSYYA